MGWAVGTGSRWFELVGDGKSGLEWVGPSVEGRVDADWKGPDRRLREGENEGRVVGYGQWRAGAVRAGESVQNWRGEMRAGWGRRLRAEQDWQGMAGEGPGGVVG